MYWILFCLRQVQISYELDFLKIYLKCFSDFSQQEQPGLSFKLLAAKLHKSRKKWNLTVGKDKFAKRAEARN